MAAHQDDMRVVGDEALPSSDEALASTRPPDDYGLVKEWILDSSRELAALRAGILAELSTAAGAPVEALDGIADAMILIATELATNAIRYGRPPTVVRLLRAHHTFLLDVADHDTDAAPYLAGPRAFGEGGFGLQIARRLALDIGWYVSDGAKHVWAVLPDGP